MYTSLIEDSRALSLNHYAADDFGEKDNMEAVAFSLKGQKFMCNDSSVKHNFSFALSFSMNCDTENEIDLRSYQIAEECSWSWLIIFLAKNLAGFRISSVFHGN